MTSMHRSDLAFAEFENFQSSRLRLLGGFPPAAKRNRGTLLMTWLIALFTLGLFVYLVYALIRPEQF